MKINVLTLFPDIVKAFFDNSIMAKAVEKGLIEYNIVDIRSFAFDRHKKCDDYPYGGGAGLVLKTEPLALALDSVSAEKKRTIFPTPSGLLYNQDYAKELSKEQEIVIICGRYEGIDQRIIDLYVNDEICIGNYVLSSGEIAGLVIIDSLYRLVDGVISSESLDEESFSNGLLEYPHYTRPEVFRGVKVPDILLSGHHKNIEKWRLCKSLEKTVKNRPDILADKTKLSADALKMLDEMIDGG